MKISCEILIKNLKMMILILSKKRKKIISKIQKKD